MTKMEKLKKKLQTHLLKKTRLPRHIYVGFCVRDLSKLIMSEWF